MVDFTCTDGSKGHQLVNKVKGLLQWGFSCEINPNKTVFFGSP